MTTKYKYVLYHNNTEVCQCDNPVEAIICAISMRMIGEFEITQWEVEDDELLYDPEIARTMKFEIKANSLNSLMR